MENNTQNKLVHIIVAFFKLNLSHCFSSIVLVENPDLCFQDVSSSNRWLLEQSWIGSQKMVCHTGGANFPNGVPIFMVKWWPRVPILLGRWEPGSPFYREDGSPFSHMTPVTFSRLLRQGKTIVLGPSIGFAYKPIPCCSNWSHYFHAVSCLPVTWPTEGVGSGHERTYD